MPGTLGLARSAFRGRQWRDAAAGFERAASELATSGDALSPADLDALGRSYALMGRIDDAAAALARAHEGHAARGDLLAAADTAGWLTLFLATHGRHSAAAGWSARTNQILDRLDGPTPQHVLGMLPTAIMRLYTEGGGAAEPALQRAVALAEPLGDDEILAIARLGLSHAWVGMGRFDDALRLLDDVIAVALANLAGPVASGVLFCGAIEICELALDLSRAREWTRALDHWCGAQPSLISFTGECEMHRSFFYQLHGEWDEALETARAAQALYQQGNVNAGFGGFYAEAEICRLRGDAPGAEAAYARAHACGWDPLPGLALLRLDQGRPAEAQELLRGTAIRTNDAYARALLPAVVEVELAAGDPAAARDAARELAEVAASHATPWSLALAAAARARVLEHDDAAAAHESARRAFALWSEIGGVYEAARCLALQARICLALGETARAGAAFASARAVFEGLGAGPALAELAALGLPERPADGAAPAGRTPSSVPAPGALSPRELEVLRYMSAGLSNRELGRRLFVSERTIARHVGSILAKLGVASRTAAAAYAYEHGLASGQN
ncbi:helix-turn-helix transcriptional regulator [Sinomonas halotolerans]|uniref:Helix-turn-helix transcriptional regulator n=1 Tax=Sinomonas halotolerans TaxID=1644133 RepID=A0ABU9WV51_9MICC